MANKENDDIVIEVKNVTKHFNVFFDRSFGIVIIKVPKQRYSKRKSQTWCIPTAALIRLFIVLQHDVSKEHSIKDCLEQAPMSH